MRGTFSRARRRTHCAAPWPHTVVSGTVWSPAQGHALARAPGSVAMGRGERSDRERATLRERRASRRPKGAQGCGGVVRLRAVRRGLSQLVCGSCCGVPGPNTTRFPGARRGCGSTDRVGSRSWRSKAVVPRVRRAPDGSSCPGVVGGSSEPVTPRRDRGARALLEFEMNRGENESRRTSGLAALLKRSARGARTHSAGFRSLT
jgi:hypothetical protein